MSKDQALELFKDNEYKIELIKNLDNSSEINLYEQENFTDLCKGPHTKVQKNMMLMLRLPVYLVLTGEASVQIKCFKEFMRLHFIVKKILINI